MPELLDHVVAGALYDFLGYLTTRDAPITLSAKHDPGPALKALGEFFTMRGVDETCAPMVEGWQSRCAQLHLVEPE